MTDDRYLTCEQMFHRLEDYLDHELAAAEVARVEEHLAICNDCAQEYRFEGDLLAGIRSKLKAAKMPPGLAQKIEVTLSSASSPDEDEQGN